MPDIDEIRNTRYIKSLSETDQHTLFQAFNSWSDRQKKEFIDEVLKMESSYDVAVEEKAKILQQQVLDLESSMAGLKKTETAARREDEKIQQAKELQTAESLLS